MEYIKSIGCNDAVFWNITTNGTLLTAEKIDYFMRYDNIVIYISLDGPESEHDRHRIFENGKGSFEIIMQNLKRIQTKNPEFYNKHIHFQPLLPRYNNPKNLFNFFSSHSLVNQNSISNSVGDISPGFLTFYDGLTKEMEMKFQTKYNRFYELYIEMLKKGDVHSRAFRVQSALAGITFEIIDGRYCRSFNNLSFSTGTCIPGTRKLYVTPNGKFYICEKVNENNSIGDYINGINYEKCKFIYEDYLSSNTKDCYKCPKIHFCGLCFAGTEDYNFNQKEYCEKQKNNFKGELSQYYSIIEENPGVFNSIGISDNK